jgi:hypothetical protein
MTVRPSGVGDGRGNGTTGGSRDPLSSPVIVHRREEGSVNRSGRRERLTGEMARAMFCAVAGAWIGRTRNDGSPDRRRAVRSQTRARERGHGSPAERKETRSAPLPNPLGVASVGVTTRRRLRVNVITSSATGYISDSVPASCRHCGRHRSRFSPCPEGRICAIRFHNGAPTGD